jgi:hypothetical protein
MVIMEKSGLWYAWIRIMPKWKHKYIIIQENCERKKKLVGSLTKIYDGTPLAVI